MSDAELLAHATEFTFPIEGGMIGLFREDDSWLVVRAIGNDQQHLSKNCGWTIADPEKPLDREFKFKYIKEALARAGLCETDAYGVFDLARRKRVGNLFSAIRSKELTHA